MPPPKNASPSQKRMQSQSHPKSYPQPSHKQLQTTLAPNKPPNPMPQSPLFHEPPPRQPQNLRHELLYDSVEERCCLLQRQVHPMRRRHELERRRSRMRPRQNPQPHRPSRPHLSHRLRHLKALRQVRPQEQNLQRCQIRVLGESRQMCGSEGLCLLVG